MNKMYNIKSELKSLKSLKARINRINLEIREIQNDSGIGAINYSERVQTSPSGDAIDNMILRRREKIDKLLIEQESIKIKIEVIENALSVLNERETKVINMLYIENLASGRVETELDRTYQQVRNISSQALEKIKDLM